MLYLVPTPIGNLKDITLRALEVLKSVDVIAAEDTRHSRKLCDHYEIKTPLTSFHAHSNDAKIKQLVSRLEAGEDVALISDAGTPGISDPAYVLLKAAREANIAIDVLPGATAFVPALLHSGFHLHTFIFYGFLPLKKGRQTLFTSWQDETKTIIFYESPHRLVKTLTQLQKFLGEDRPVSVSRELTKIYQETIRGSLKEVAEHFNNKKPKGEIVVCLGT